MSNIIKGLTLSTLMCISLSTFSQDIVTTGLSAYTKKIVDENSLVNKVAVLEIYVIDEVPSQADKFKFQINVQRKGCLEKNTCENRKLSIDHTTQLLNIEGGTLNARSLSQGKTYPIKSYTTQQNNSRRLKEVIFE